MSTPQLTQIEIDSFFDFGYFVRHNLFSPDEVTEMTESFDRLQSKARGLSSPELLEGSLFVVHGFRIDRIVWCGAAEGCLLDYGSDSRLTVPAAQLLGQSKMEHLICQAHFKLPADGVGFGWHQDSEHRRYGTSEWVDINGRGSFVQTILAIDPATHENGPLRIVPGSCRFGHLGLDKDHAKLPKIDASQTHPMLLAAGSVLFLNPFTIHGSEPNQSSLSRRVFINGYAYPGANRRVYPGDGAGRTLEVRADQDR